MDAAQEGIEQHAGEGERIVWTHNSDRASTMLTAIADADGAGAPGYRIRTDRAGQLATSDVLTCEAALGLAAAIIYDDEQQHWSEVGTPTLSREAHDLLLAIATGPGGVDPRIGDSRLHHPRFSRPIQHGSGAPLVRDVEEAASGELHGVPVEQDGTPA